MSDDELFTRLIYNGLAHLHLTEPEIWLTPFGELLDLIECYRQEIGLAVPYTEHFIDEIFPADL